MHFSLKGYKIYQQCRKNAPQYSKRKKLKKQKVHAQIEQNCFQT
jgi:hypothetical protein